MTLKIKKGRLRLFLWCPVFLSGFVLRKVVAGAAKRSEEGKEDYIFAVPDKRVFKDIVKAARAAKRYRKRIEIISVKAADGTRVRISL